MVSRPDLSKQLQTQLREALGALRRDADAGYREALDLLQSCADEVSEFLRGAGRTPVEVFLELGHVVDMGQEYRLVVTARDIGLSDHLFRAYVPAGGFPVELDYLAEESIRCINSVDLVSQLVKFIENANVKARLSAIAQVLNDETVRSERTEVERFEQPLKARRGAVVASRPAPNERTRRTTPESPLDELTPRLLSHIRQRPGQRIEIIAEELKESTRALSGAVQRLKSAGQISTKGQGRATAYYPASGAKQAGR